MKRNWLIWIAVSLSALLVVAIFVRFADQKPPQDDPILIDYEPQEPIDEIIGLRHPFNGRIIEEEQAWPAFAAIIENTSQARPHSGIALADIVYEIAVEGYSITRFFAIFSENHPSKIGPIRSARIPFAQLLIEPLYPFVHFGSAETGEGNALTIIESLNLPIRFDGHKGINASFFFRDDSRRAPHNAYFDASRALSRIPSREYVSHFIFNEESNINNRRVSELSLRYSSSNTVRYIFDDSNQNYRRFIGDDPMLDTVSESQVSVTNIIVLHAPHRVVEQVRYVLVDFIGEGKAEFFVNGYHEVGHWIKESETSKTQFFDSQGQEIVLLPGNTWIQVVHPNVEILRDGAK